MYYSVRKAAKPNNNNNNNNVSVPLAGAPDAVTSTQEKRRRKCRLDAFSVLDTLSSIGVSKPAKKRRSEEDESVLIEDELTQAPPQRRCDEETGLYEIDDD